MMRTNDSLPHPKRNTDRNPDPITGAPGSHPVGTAVGAAGGAVLGAALGSLGGPLGIMVGGTIGALAGGLTGKEVAESFDPALETTYWQEHYRDEPYVEPEYDYDDYGPAYLLGAGRQGYHRSFEEAEKGMEEGWEDLKDQSRIPWEKARHAARAGWVRHEPMFRGGGNNG